MVYVTIAITWIIVPAYLTPQSSLTTAIVGNTCMPWYAFSSKAAEKLVFSAFFVTYLLPLIAMVFCYSRIVYKLRSKVAIVL